MYHLISNPINLFQEKSASLNWILFCAIFSSLFLCSCGPLVSTKISRNYGPLTYKENIVVLGLHDSIPKQAEKLGEVYVGDNGFTNNCSWAVVVERAKYEARKVGGNAIKITKHTPPSMLGSTCHRITAKILKVSNPADLLAESSLINSDCAVLHIYRHSGYGSLVSFKLHLADSLICKVGNNFKTTIKIKKEGLFTLSAQTEAPEELMITLEKGKEYYIRCSIVTGTLVGHPKLELVKNDIGRAEFQSFKSEDDGMMEGEYNETEETNDDIYYKIRK